MYVGLVPIIKFAIAVISGWLVGGLANWAADVLPDWNRDTRQPSLRDWNTRHYLSLSWYVTHKGVCPHCGAARGLRAPLLELAIVAAVSYSVVRFGYGARSLSISTHAVFLLTVLVIDLEHRRVLNVMLAPAAIIAVVFSLVLGQPEPLAALLGGLVGFGIFALLALLSRGKLGAGDVKLAGVIGLMVGFPNVFVTLFAGVLLGGIAAILLLLTRRAGRKDTMAYAPYLSLGAIVMLFYWPG